VIGFAMVWVLFALSDQKIILHYLIYIIWIVN